MRRAVLVVLLASCTRSSSDRAPFAAPTGVTARLATPTDVDVSWTPVATEDGGAWVELATPGDDFVKLDAVWRDATAYRHPDVAPDTTLLYRLRPFFGQPSPGVAVHTGADADVLEAEGPLDEPRDTRAGASLRSATTFAAAAPADLSAVARGTEVTLRWRDRASDEDAVLVEISDDDGRSWRVCAVLPPGATSFRKTGLPPHSRWQLRVRAVFNGAPSAVVSVTTPAPTGATRTPATAPAPPT